jgi:hypothetical protein
MEFLKGLAAGLGGFTIWIMASMFGALSAISDENGEVNPFWYVLIVIGFAIMFLGPIYYWLLEGFIRKKPVPPVYAYQQPAYPPQQAVQSPSTKVVYCGECGQPVTAPFKFCNSCGAALS